VAIGFGCLSNTYSSFVSLSFTLLRDSEPKARKIEQKLSKHGDPLSQTVGMPCGDRNSEVLSIVCSVHAWDAQEWFPILLFTATVIVISGAQVLSEWEQLSTYCEILHRLNRSFVRSIYSVF